MQGSESNLVPAYTMYCPLQNTNKQTNKTKNTVKASLVFVCFVFVFVLSFFLCVCVFMKHHLLRGVDKSLKQWICPF